jgi:phenylpyruvate tautomerase PptA (4-oxalocrotonate tautomerase family)
MLKVELPVGHEVLSSAPTLIRNLNVFQPTLHPEETIMPFARIDLLKGKTAEYRATVADIVYQGIVGVLKAPDGDRFIVISEHSPDNLIYDPHFLGWDRSPDFILIQVTSTVGNNKDSKLAFFRYVADELKSKLSVRPDDVMINMVFVDRSDWSFGNGEPWV